LPVIWLLVRLERSRSAIAILLNYLGFGGEGIASTGTHRFAPFFVAGAVNFFQSAMNLLTVRFGSKAERRVPM
jgi:hypothetical protein